MNNSREFPGDAQALNWLTSMQSERFDNIEFFSTSKQLPSGITVRLRAVKAEDKYELLKAYHELSDQTIYLRFMRTRFAPDLKQVSYFTDLDFSSHVSLVVEKRNDKYEFNQIIGVGRFILVDDISAKPCRAEYACIITDQYQRCGVGRLLFHYLVFLAIHHGVDEFVAEVLPENRGMLNLFRAAGLPMKMAFGDGIINIGLSLTPMARNILINKS